jgi:hypothetical protein
MKKTMSMPMVFAVVSVLFIAGRAYALDASAVSGTITCSGNTVISSVQAAHGTATLVSDGNGHWMSGSPTYQLDAAGTQGSCNYTLDSGKYEVNPNGTAMSYTHWTLVAANSSTACRDVVQSSVLFSVAGSATSGSQPSGTYSGSQQEGAYQESGVCTQSQ